MGGEGERKQLCPLLGRPGDFQEASVKEKKQTLI